PAPQPCRRLPPDSPTKKLWPSSAERPRVVVRAIVSVGPPAGYGTTTLTACSGKFCARAAPDHAAAAPPRSVMNSRLRIRFTDGSRRTSAADFKFLQRLRQAREGT